MVCWAQEHVGHIIWQSHMIADIEANKKLSSIITELFLRGRKLNILLIFISQSYFKVPKTIETKRDTLFYHENT